MKQENKISSDDVAYILVLVTVLYFTFNVLLKG